MHRPPRAGAPTAQRHAPVRTRRVGPSRAPHPCGSRAHRRTGGARRPGVPPTARAPDASVTGTGAGRRSNDPSPVDRSVAGAQLRQMRWACSGGHAGAPHQTSGFDSRHPLSTWSWHASVRITDAGPFWAELASLVRPSYTNG